MAVKITAQQAWSIDPADPVYVIGVVSQLVRLPVWTLRALDRQGLVKPKRRGGRGRLYSLNDLRRLHHIRRLMQEQGVNVHGVRIILRMTVVE